MNVYSPAVGGKSREEPGGSKGKPVAQKVVMEGKIEKQSK